MRIITIIWVSILAGCGWVQAQTLTLTLDKTIALATDSSLDAFRQRNLYLSSFWKYRSFKAERLPSLSLNLTPAQYYRYITQRYDSNNEKDIFIPIQNYRASAGLQINQNFDLLGGYFYINSGLQYMRSFGENITGTQFSSVPISIGYNQNLLGYNAFKWQKKIEPLRFEKAKKDLIYNMEAISESTTEHFFTLAMAQVEFDMARDNLSSTDTLYRIGQERQKIASITQADLLRLKLEAVNARNDYQNKEIALKRAMFSLASYLNFDKNTSIRVDPPGRPREMEISVNEALTLARENNPSFLSMRQDILEAEQEVDKTKKEAMFNAQFNTSVGFNQVDERFRYAYRDLQRQDIVTVSISIPLIDWGVRKGRYNMAKNNLSIAQISARQEELTVEEDVIMTVSDFNIQKNLILSAEEALDIAIMAYEETRQRFILGKEDINSLSLSLQQQQAAYRNYVSALQNYWLSYYKIRRLTLHDFDTGFPLNGL